MAHTPGQHSSQGSSRQTLSRIATAAANGLQMLLGLALIFVVGVNVVNATGRYFFGVAPLGADELMVFIVIWTVMIAAVASLVARSHINVNLLPFYASGRARHLLHIVHDGAALLACGYATYASWLFIGRISSLGLRSMGLGLPMTIPHAALVAGFGAMTAVAAVMLVRDLLAFLRNTPLEEAEQ